MGGRPILQSCALGEEVSLKIVFQFSVFYLATT